MRRAIACVLTLAACGSTSGRKLTDGGGPDFATSAHDGAAGAPDFATAPDDAAAADDLAAPPDLAARDAPVKDLAGADLALGCAPKVNEVMTTGAANTDEFVELYNPCQGAVDISGWKLAYRSAGNNNGGGDTTLFVVPANTAIPAGGFLVYCGATFAGACDAKLMSGLAQQGGAVALRTAAGPVADSVAYDALTAPNDFTETMPAPHPPTNGAIGRTPDGADSDDNSFDFKVEMAPTPKVANK